MRRLPLCVVVVVVGLSWIVGCSGSSDNCEECNVVDRVDVQIQTQGGYVRGERDTSKGFNVFRGIPFAEPPVGDRRWTNPVPKKAWSPQVRTNT